MNNKDTDSKVRTGSAQERKISPHPVRDEKTKADALAAAEEIIAEREKSKFRMDRATILKLRDEGRKR
ncbi:MAG: hypothetical protein EPN26_01140 [Rhodospirillales bacterium]|nr:MAG: hypothetical protein EPN26_01140 [Rhodospirillales bacterium]